MNPVPVNNASLPLPLDRRTSERFCRELARREARNFYWGFLALPRDQRTAIYALYAFARQVDDEVDIRASVDGDRFNHHRERIVRAFSGETQDPVMDVLAGAVRTFGIRNDELEALIEGVEMDLLVNRYRCWDDLAAYCRLVASSVGRMCVRIFGFTDEAALLYADELGLALQTVNILRDVREDLDRGRIYLPLEDLARFGIEEQELIASRPGPGWENLVRFEIARAHDLFNSGLRVTAPIPRRAAACVLTMAGIYQAILGEIERDPYLPLRRRASVSGRRKLTVMARSWLRA